MRKKKKKGGFFIWNRSQSLKNCLAVESHTSLLPETFPFEKGQDKCYSSLFNMLNKYSVHTIIIIIILKIKLQFTHL